MEDYGVRHLRYGNASGGIFQGAYRSLLIEYGGSTEFVSLGFSCYATYAKPDILKTALNVAIDSEDSAHLSLQLSMDDNLAVTGDDVAFYHHGRIGVGKIGSGRIDELREFIRERYPAIISGNRFCLGMFRNDHLWNLDQPDVIKLVENLISYALVRDEYRNYVKKNRI